MWLMELKLDREIDKGEETSLSSENQWQGFEIKQCWQQWPCNQKKKKNNNIIWVEPVNPTNLGSNSCHNSRFFWMSKALRGGGQKQYKIYSQNKFCSLLTKYQIFYFSSSCHELGNVWEALFWNLGLCFYYGILQFWFDWLYI